jgi:hypothetical protein
MRIVQGDQVPQTPAEAHRPGTTTFRRLLDGTPGPDNFSLVLAEGPGDRYSPRHKHNFEQVRVQLEGSADYGRTGKMTPGMVGYFPEGVPYGPQTQTPGEYVSIIVLQCGGASGSGYIGRDEQQVAIVELSQTGEFKDGVFYRKEGLPGKRNLDGFQAIWEHVNQRTFVPTKPRYETPILMQSGNYDFVPVEGAPGLSEKLLGSFTERRSVIAYLKLDAGARFVAQGKHDIFVVLSGRGTLEGTPYRPLTTLYVEQGEQAAFSAEATTEILHLGMPNLAGLAAIGEASAQAAE